MRKFIKFLKLPLLKKCMLLEAMIYSAKYRWQILHRPFREIAANIGTFKYETEHILYNDPSIHTVGWAVDVMRYHVPWDSQCLDRALAARKMLNKRGYPCTLYMGVIQNQKKEMTAHAWLRCGNRWVTGGNGEQAGYAITAIYGDQTH